MRFVASHKLNCLSYFCSHGDLEGERGEEDSVEDIDDLDTDDEKLQGLYYTETLCIVNF